MIVCIMAKKNAQAFYTVGAASAYAFLGVHVNNYINCRKFYYIMNSLSLSIHKLYKIFFINFARRIFCVGKQRKTIFNDKFN